ncbi:cell wall-associated NlpC family hydrolase [Weissella beninensis]|uniref:C40 family peptidase n=1 Tax=Periweissella beninensis TaxID=504936 RepID=A0ABT0VKT1_9LACO|nr:C40 family peptidase [Periweissella beninensis]MBM7544378.1 cell wall-associated NlpC family hydrolase [Periweissella beninensis]MCM2437753.1 C40 family peptidase [Periweissella beninensis]
MKKIIQIVLAVSIIMVTLITFNDVQADSGNDHLISSSKSVKKYAYVKHSGNIYDVDNEDVLTKSGIKTKSYGSVRLKVTKKATAIISGHTRKVYYVSNGSIAGWVRKTNLTFVKKGDVNGAQIIAYAKKFKGTPYVWGGTTPNGFDCSGFTQYVYRKVTGKNIGRTAANQALSRGAKQIAVAKAKPGDLLIWGNGSSAYHVGISTGYHKWINAFKPGRRLGNASYATFSNHPSYAVHINLDKLTNY